MSKTARAALLGMACIAIAGCNGERSTWECILKDGGESVVVETRGGNPAREWGRHTDSDGWVRNDFDFKTCRKVRGK